MMKSESKIYPVILAGGLGTRMAGGRPSPIPKPLIKLSGKPMVSYILETLRNIETEKLRNIKIGKPILVIGPKLDLFKKEFGDNCQYVIQKEALGTAHAAKLAIDYITNSNIGFRDGKQIKMSKIPKSKHKLSGRFEYLNLKNDLGLRASDSEFKNKNLVLILQGDDSAFYQSDTLEKFIINHCKEKAILSFLTTKLNDPKEFGRVIRNQKGEVVDIVEKENLSVEQKKIKEINCGGYLMDLAWAEENIKKIRKHYKKGKEYPLPDIIKIGLQQGRRVIAFPIDSSEWFGINSPEQLKEAEKLIKKIRFS